MTAQTFTALGNAATTSPIFRPDGKGAPAVYFGGYTITETPEVGDIWPLFRVPYGFKPLFGIASFTDIDTGTESLEIDIGIAANGVDSADSDYFVNSGVLTGDAITDLTPTPAASIRFFVPTAPAAFGAETLVQAECIAVAAGGATGTMHFIVFGVVN